MGFWSTLAKVAPFAAFAIPGVGPAVGAGLKSLGGVGAWLGTPGGAAVAGLGGDLLGGWMQGRAMNRGLDLQAAQNERAQRFLELIDARDFAEYLKERDRDWRMQDQDRTHAYAREAEREARLAPFRQGAERGYQTLSSLLYNPDQPMAQTPAISPAITRRSMADLLR